MTDATTSGSAPSNETNEKFALRRAGAAAAALSGSAAAGALVLGADAAMVALTALAAIAGIAIGHVLGRVDGRAARAARALTVRVASELREYRAFTRLLRDQGARIIESTCNAATMIVAGLNEIDATVDHMRVLVDHIASDDLAELRSLVEAVGAPVLGMLGHLQFQDVTQQQIAFLSRLSLILDDHMVQLSHQLGSGHAMKPVAKFNEMFDEAIGDCVMDNQRDDHHAALGLAMREDSGSRLELF